VSVEVHGVQQHDIGSLAADCFPVRTDGGEGGEERDHPEDLRLDVGEDRWPPELKERTASSEEIRRKERVGQEGGGERSLRARERESSSKKRDLLLLGSFALLLDLRRTHLGMPVERKSSDRKANKEVKGRVNDKLAVASTNRKEEEERDAGRTESSESKAAQTRP